MYSGFSAAQSTDSLGGNDVSLSYYSGLPDPNNIYDPKFKVLFKSLLKRDSTTKERTLNELLTHLSSNSISIDEDVHWAWTQIYPKLAIDSSRNVRITSQKIQGKLGLLLGKRLAKYLKYNVTPWLFGLYDMDRVVISTTQNSLDTVFSTPEKRSALFTVFLDQHLDLIYNLITIENSNTLSDERFVSKEESESKYSNTLKCAIELFSHLLFAETYSEAKKEKFSRLLEESALWKLSYSDDVLVSRAALKLISKFFLDKEQVSWADQVKPYVATALISKGLSSVSTFVAVDFLQALIKLTQYDPKVWDTVTSKKTPLSRLSSFIKKGNRAKSQHYWASILKLLSILPPSVSPYSFDSDSAVASKNAETLSTAAFEAASFETGHTWGYVMAIAEKIESSSSSRSDTIIKLLFQTISKTFLSPESQISNLDETFDIIGKKTADIYSISPEVTSAELESIIDRLKTGSAINSAKLFNSIVSHIGISKCPSLVDALAKIIISELDELSDDLKDVNKSHFAITILELMGNVILSKKPVVESYYSLVNTILESFEEYGTNEELLAIVSTFIKTSKDIKPISESLTHVQQTLSTLVYDDEKTIPLVSSFLSLYSAFIGLKSPEEVFSEYISGVVALLFRDISSVDSQNVVKYTVLSHDTFVTKSVSQKALEQLFQSILREDLNHAVSLDLVNALVKDDQSFLVDFSHSDEGKTTVSDLWRAAETHEDGKQIDTLLKQLVSLTIDKADGGSRLADDIKNELLSVSLEEVAMLVERGRRLIETATSNEDKAELLQSLLLDNNSWASLLDDSFEQGLSPDLSLSPEFGNTLFLISDTDIIKPPSKSLIGPSLINVTVFTTSLINMFSEVFLSLPYNTKVLTLSSLCYAGEFTDLTLNMTSDFYVTNTENHDLHDVLLASINDIHSIVAKAMNPVQGQYEIFLDALTTTSKNDSVALELLRHIWDECQKLDAKAFYSSRILERLLSIIYVNHDEKSVDLFKGILNKFERNPLGCFSILNVLKHSTVLDSLSSLRNNILGSLMTIPFSQLHTNGLRSMVLFISSLCLNDFTKSGLPFFKLTNFINSLASLISSDDVFEDVYTPIITLASQLFEKIGDAFVDDLSLSFWEKFTTVFEKGFVLVTFGSAFDNALLVSMFNLFAKMKALGENKEDAKVALENMSPSFYELALENLSSIEGALNHLQDFKSQAVAKGLIGDVSTLEVELETMYRLVGLEDKALGILGLTMLKNYLSKTQKDKSIAFTLLKQPVDPETTDLESYLLPSELLSLVLESPIGQSEARKRQFVYAWYVLFLYFEQSVTSLRRFFGTQLAEGNYANVLLDFCASEVMNGLTKDTETHWKIEFLEPAIDLLNDHDIERCTWNIYFQAASNIGQLTRTWYRELKKQNVYNSITQFTETYISPLVIEQKVAAVRLAVEQGNVVDDTFEINTSKTDKSITAHYLFDNMTMTVMCQYPKNYPLSDVLFEPVKMIGVNAKQWRSWILASQFALRTNGGSVLDALDLFKKNVTLHFEGIEPCSICYSIVYEDYTLPNRTCRTCHNKFHSHCLNRWFKTSNSSDCPLCRSKFN